MKTPITYYGGKQKLAATLLPMIPAHTLYCEPFLGGGAIFFAKEPSAIEVLNDTNQELINFYRVVQTDFLSLEKEIRVTLHSRRLHKDAEITYTNPHLFSSLKRAWALWVLSSQSFASMLDGTWGYDKTKDNTTTKKVHNKKSLFIEDFAIRLQNVQVECADALYIINSRDNNDAFFYCDPPYYNSNCGHYDGYTKDDFELLLKLLAKIKGKFMLSSYPSDLLASYTKRHKWHTKKIEQVVSVNNRRGKGIQKKKTETITWNY